MKEYVNEADDFDYEDYVFNPKEIIENGKSIIDYTGEENNKVYLVNKTDILTKPRPSWIPEFDPEGLKADAFLPVTVHDSNGNYYVQSKIKTGEHEKTLNNYHQTKVKVPEFTTKIYKMNLDVLSATIDYYLKRERALLKEQGINKSITLPRALKSMSIERYNDMVNLLSFCSNYRESAESANIFRKYPRRSSSEGAKLQNHIVFTEQYQPFLSDLKDKKLDLNYQKIDYANSRQKGEETSYGESNTINDLLDQFGVRIKKQNGTGFKEEEIKRFKEAINKVNDYYGNLKELSQKYDLILSYADNCHQYARSAIGLFSPYHQAIGVSFFDTDKMNERGASGDTILSHEVAHWLDNQKGQESADWYASNKAGTLENKIALAYKAELRKYINSLNEKSSITNESKTVKLGDYWYRTCECLARSVEQDYAIKHGIKIDEKGYLPEDIYKAKIQPMVQELLDENRKYFNLETLNTNKSQSINTKENKLMNKSENNPITYFVKDTVEFEMLAGFEPITGLTAEEAVAKFTEMKNKNYDCGIGINIPGDVVFDDPDGLGLIIFEAMTELHKFSFYIGDTFVKTLKVKNEHSKNVIKAFKDLDSAIRNSGIYADGLYDEPAFLFEKEKELGFVNKQSFTSEEENTLISLGFKKHEFHIDDENVQVVDGNNDEWFEKANGNTVVKIWIEPEQGTNGRTFNWSNTIEKEGFNNLLWERGENEMDYPSLMGCLLSITKRSIPSSERPLDDEIITPKQLVPFLSNTDKDFYLNPGKDIKNEPFVKAMKEAIEISDNIVQEIPVPKSARNKLSGRTKIWFAGSDKTVQDMLDFLGERNMADFSLEQKADNQLYIQGYDNGGKLRGKMNVSEEELEYLYSKLNSPEAKVHLNERFNKFTGKSFKVDNKTNDIINNFILNKLEKAGIKVVTEKEEYNRILKSHSQNIPQKLIMDWVSEKEIDYPKINKAEEILPLLNNYNKTPQELFMAISLDGSRKPISCRIVSAGTVNLSLVHPREVFREAIKDNAAALIVSHNHPSGNVQPSDQDIRTTKTLLEASKIIGIPILDHIITSPNQKDYYSFNEHGLIQNMKENGVTYGFVYEDKIYLDPDLLNSRVAIHEYTHLWDNFTMRTNSELWDKGLQLFKNTKYWNEVISDPNYQDIKDDDNLVLSEIHSRICGEMAEKVFNRIAELDGEQVKLDAIDWNVETWNYISEVMLSKDSPLNCSNGLTSSDLTEFLSTPMKDFMNEKQITRKIPDMNLSDIQILMMQRKKDIEVLSEIEKELNVNPSNPAASANKVTFTNSLNEINSEIRQETIKILKERGFSDIVLEYTDEKTDSFTQSFRVLVNGNLMGSVSVVSDGFIGGKDNQGNHFNLEQPETTKMFKEYLEREIGKGAYKDFAPEPDKSFRYYLTQRPVSIGTQPDGFINQESFEEKKYDNDAGRAVYGYVEYDHELSEKEIKDFELSKPNPFREVIIEPSSDNKLDYPYVLFGRIGDMKGTPLSNYNARISNANLEIKFNGFKSFEEAIALVKNNFKPLEQNISNAINDAVHELTGEIDNAFRDAKKQIEADKKIEDEITEDLKVEIANRLEGVPLENQPVITRVKVYKPEDYGFEADGKLHVLAEYETDTGFREDSLFNLLHDEDEPLFYNGNIIDVNPITPEKSGTIESYLENLKSMPEKRNVSVENEPLEKARIVADYIIQLGMERSSDLENCHVSFEDIPLDVADQKWVKEHYEDINHALAEHNDNELLEYYGDENEENEFNLYFCSNADEGELNTLFRKDETGRWIRKPEIEIEIEEKMNEPGETNDFIVLRSDSDIVKLWDEHPEQVRKGIYLLKKNDTYITIDNSSGDCWTEEFDSLYKAFIYVNFAEGVEQIQELSEETAKNICMDYEITEDYFENLEQKIEEINNLSPVENEKLYRNEIEPRTVSPLEPMKEADALRNMSPSQKDFHIAGTMLENVEMSENGQFILNETSNGMLSKYIDKSEISTIDEFRNYAAVRITGNLQDRTPGNDYFSQLYNLGIKFCIERGYQLPVFSQEIYDKALEDYKIEYSENETFSMNGYFSEADEFYKALPEMNILQVQALLSGSKEFFQTNNELLNNNIYPHITVKKDGNISIDLQVYVTDKDPDNPVKTWRINDSINEKNRSHIIQKFSESIKEKEFNGEKVPDWVTNILNKKENTIAHEVSENKNVSNSTNVFQKQAKPFDIIYNEEKGRVNIRFNPAKQNPYFNEIIKELKNENWHFAKSTRSWYPIKIAGSSEFAKEIFEKYQNLLASEKEKGTSISSESVIKTATIQEGDNNPYSGLKFFDRNYEEGKDFLVYLNKNLKEGERPLSLSESQIILNALNHEDIGLLNQRSHRLALDVNNVLTIVEKHESEVIKIKTNLNELLKTAKEMAEFSVAEFEQKLKTTEQNSKDIPGFDFNVHFKSMYENCLVDSKKVSENMHDIFDSYYNKFQEISSDDFLSVQAAKKAKLIENGEPYVEITFSESSDGKRLEKGTVWTLNEAEVLFPKKNEEFKGAYLKVDYTVNLFDKEGEEVSYSGTMDLGTDHPLEPFSDYIRMMCSYDEVLNAYETSWEKMNTPSLSAFQKRRVENILYPHMEHLTERFAKLKDELCYVMDVHKTLIQPVIMDVQTFESSEKEVDKIHGKIKNLFEREINSSINDLYEYLEEQKSPELEKFAEHKLKNILQDVQYSESRKQNMDFDYGFWRESLKNIPAATEYDSIINKDKDELLKEIEEIKATRKQNGTSKLPVAKFTNFNYFPSRFVEYMKTGNPQGLSNEDKLMADSFVRENKLKFGCIEVKEGEQENCSHPDLGEPCETVRASFKTTEYFMMPELKNGDTLDSDIVSNVIKLGEGVYQANFGEGKGNHFIVDQQIGNNISTKIRNLFSSKGNRFVVENKLFDPYVCLELIEKNIIPPRDNEYLQNLRSYVKENPLACTIFKTSFREGITEDNIGSVNLIDKWYNTFNNFAKTTFRNLSRNDQEEVKKWFGKLEISNLNPIRNTKLSLSTLLPEKLGVEYRKLNNLTLSKTKNNGYPPRGE